MRHLSDRWRAKESTMGLHRLICRAISRWQHHRNHVPSAAASQGPVPPLRMIFCAVFSLVRMPITGLPFRCGCTFGNNSSTCSEFP